MNTKKFKLPKPGDKFPPLENDLNPPNANDQDATNEYLQRAGQQDALTKTEKAVQEYEGTIFPNWFQNYDTGRAVGPTGKVGDPNAIPPSPPLQFWAVAIVNEGGGIVYESQQVGPPACEVPPYPRIPAPPH